MSVEELELKEVICAECGKPISAIPHWLCSAKVKFQCEECKQRHPRIPGMVEAAPRGRVAEIDELALPDVVDEVIEEDEDVEPEAEEFEG